MYFWNTIMMKTGDDMKYYSRLKTLRLEARLSQADVAKILKCSQVGYGMYELGKRKIPVEKLIQLAKLYHTSLDYIAGLTDERTPRPNLKSEEETSLMKKAHPMAVNCCHGMSFFRILEVVRC